MTQAEPRRFRRHQPLFWQCQSHPKEPRTPVFYIKRVSKTERPWLVVVKWPSVVDQRTLHEERVR